MLEEFLESDIFVRLMRVHVSEVIDLLLQEGVEFMILANLEGVYFEPRPPQEVEKNFKPMISFSLANYTLQSAKIYDKILQFEAGFGKENVGSQVSVHLDNILQIIVKDTPIFINLSIPKNKEEQEEMEEKASDEEGISKSMEALLSNPENKKFLKKKKSLT